MSLQHPIHAPIKIHTTENGLVVKIGDKVYCVEGTDEDFLKWWRAYRDNERLEYEERAKGSITIGPATFQPYATHAAAQLASSIDHSTLAGLTNSKP